MGTVGAASALHPLSAWALSGPHITYSPWHSAVDVTRTRQTAQGVALLKGVVTMTTRVTEKAFHMFLKEKRTESEMYSVQRMGGCEKNPIGHPLVCKIAFPSLQFSITVVVILVFWSQR